MGNLFLSYAREDRHWAEQLASALAAKGIDIWWDYQLVGGERFRDKIAAELQRSTEVVVLWSSASIKSDFVRDEAQRALKSNKYIGVLLEDVELPLGFGELHAIPAKLPIEAAEAISVTVRHRATATPQRSSSAARAHDDTNAGDAVGLGDNSAAEVAASVLPEFAAVDPKFVNALLGTVPPDRRIEFASGLRAELDKVKREGFSILLVGRTGVGKSSTVNSLVGKEVAKTNTDMAETSEVTAHDTDVEGVKLTVFDTPGLCDELEEVGNDAKYLEKVRNNVRTIDLMLFVTRLDDTRVSNDEKRGIKALYEQLGPTIWKHSVIVLTHANKVEKEKFKDKLAKRAELLRAEIGRHSEIGIDTAQRIPAVAIDNTTRFLPDNEPWFEEFYTTATERMRANGTIAFRVATEPHVKPQPVSSGYSGSSYSFSDSQRGRIDTATETARTTWLQRADSWVSTNFPKARTWIKDTFGW